MGWARHKGGHGWRVLEDGRIEVEREGFPRTNGDPLTAHTLYNDHSAALEEAASYFELSVALLVGVICVEAAQESPDWWRRDPTSYRKEPDGRESGGLMQTLLGTANTVNERFGLYHDLHGDLEAVELQDLYVAERSIMLGAGYLRMVAEREGTEDPVKLQAGYNAGGVYEDDGNRFNLRVYHPSRIPNFIAYHNDFLSI